MTKTVKERLQEFKKYTKDFYTGPSGEIRSDRVALTALPVVTPLALGATALLYPKYRNAYMAAIRANEARAAEIQLMGIQGAELADAVGKQGIKKASLSDISNTLQIGKKANELYQRRRETVTEEPSNSRLSKNLSKRLVKNYEPSDALPAFSGAAGYSAARLKGIPVPLRVAATLGGYAAGEGVRRMIAPAKKPQPSLINNRTLKSIRKKDPVTNMWMTDELKRKALENELIKEGPRQFNKKYFGSGKAALSTNTSMESKYYNDLTRK